MPTWAGSSAQFKVFAYLLAEKARQYVAILRVFLQAKARFAPHLRPAEIITALHRSGSGELSAPGELDAALQQLCEWGNLAAHPDTTDVASVEEFYRPRYFYQLTLAGEAAERSLNEFREAVERPGELQSAALADIRVLLENLADLQAGSEPDEATVHRTWLALRERFDELTSKAQTFIGGLQRTVDLQTIDVEAFLAYKEMLVKYLERFVGELVLVAGEIAAVLERLERADVERLLQIAARRDLADSFVSSAADHQAAFAAWKMRWDGLRAWFVGRPDAPSQAELLRARARAAILALLSAVAGFHDRRMTDSDRAADLRTLARWFAEADRDEDAHRLWKAAFALTPSRHLGIDPETLAERDENPVPPQTSWLNAPPLRISPRLRATGRQAVRFHRASIVDHSRDKRTLADLAESELQQIAAAQRRLATGKTLRLSELAELDPTEFELFLDLLGEALAAQPAPTEPVEATSSDGSLAITLRPTEDGARAVIRTSAGLFSGLDYFVTIRKVFPEGHAEQSEALLARIARLAVHAAEIEAI